MVYHPFLRRPYTVALYGGSEFQRVLKEIFESENIEAESIRSLENFVSSLDKTSVDLLIAQENPGNDIQKKALTELLDSLQKENPNYATIVLTEKDVPKDPFLFRKVNALMSQKELSMDRINHYRRFVALVERVKRSYELHHPSRRRQTAIIDGEHAKNTQFLMGGKADVISVNSLNELRRKLLINNVDLVLVNPNNLQDCSIILDNLTTFYPLTPHNFKLEDIANITSVERFLNIRNENVSQAIGKRIPRLYVVLGGGASGKTVAEQAAQSALFDYLVVQPRINTRPDYRSLEVNGEDSFFKPESYLQELESEGDLFFSFRHRVGVPKYGSNGYAVGVQKSSLINNFTQGKDVIMVLANPGELNNLRGAYFNLQQELKQQGINIDDMKVIYVEASQEQRVASSMERKGIPEDPKIVSKEKEIYDVIKELADIRVVNEYRPGRIISLPFTLSPEIVESQIQLGKELSHKILYEK